MGFGEHFSPDQQGVQVSCLAFSLSLLHCFLYVIWVQEKFGFGNQDLESPHWL